MPAKRALTAFAQDAAAAVLPRLEDYFGLPYPFGKLDQLGIPDFEAGAMENAGCITFREVALLLDPATAPLAMQKRVAEVITHELAHQWFGNLVTMVWWDDLWLNEAFATWMAFKIVAAWRPEWRIWMDFEVGKGSALVLDAMQSAHPIRADSTTSLMNRLTWFQQRQGLFAHPQVVELVLRVQREAELRAVRGHGHVDGSQASVLGRDLWRQRGFKQAFKALQEKDAALSLPFRGGEVLGLRA